MSERPTEKALQEFLSEAQEIIETLNRSLLRLDDERRSGVNDPELVNDAFRAVHSLKGLSGLFGIRRMIRLAHRLEDLLDGLRLGRLSLTSAMLDHLFEAVELFQRVIARAAEGMGADGEIISSDDGAEGGAVDELVARLDRLTDRPPDLQVAEGDPLADIDPGLVAVLTEYEEHRLRENLRARRGLFRVTTSFPLDALDTQLDAVKSCLKAIGEIITYLPSTDPGDDDRIDIDLIVGSTAPLGRFVEVLGALPARVEPLSARGADPPAVDDPLPPREPSRARAAPARPREPAGDDEDEPPRLPSLRSISQLVRVDIRKLDHLMNIVGELSLARAGIQSVLELLRADRARPELARALHREARGLGRKLDELQAAILEVRMVPLGQVFDKLSRVVRRVSREAGKEIVFAVTGADTELDKLIVEELSDPLMHIIRNSVDHAIEVAEDRVVAGKPAAGTIALTAGQRGNHVVITIEDDGAGLDAQKLLRRAIERGLIDETQARDLSRREIHNLIFLPGLTTRDSASELSGRGVGMDVVKTNIARLSGLIDIESEPGLGTRITLTLPITLAIVQALVIRTSGRTYTVPLNSVLESLLITPADVRTIEGREVMTLRGATLPIVRIEDLFRIARRVTTAEKLYVVVVGLAQHRVGLLIDELVGQQDIVIKPLGRALAGLPGIAGATELGGQQIVLVLDVASLVEEALHLPTIEAAS